MKHYNILKSLPMNSYFWFQASVYIWQCHPGEPGDLLSANRIFHCRPVDSSGHLSQNQPGPLPLFWTISLSQATSFRHIFPLNWSPVALCRPGQTPTVRNLWTNQEPSSRSSGWTRWTIWPSPQTGQSLLKIHPSCLLHILFPPGWKISEGGYHHCHQCNSWTVVLILKSPNRACGD